LKLAFKLKAFDSNIGGNMIDCSNENCENELDIDLNSLECESNGSSGSHTTSYTYTGIVVCPDCSAEIDVIIDTDECDDTEDILSYEFQ